MLITWGESRVCHIPATRGLASLNTLPAAFGDVWAAFSAIVARSIERPVAAASALTVNLSKDSATGAFDTSRSGSFNGTVTSVTIPAGKSYADVYYKDTTAGTPTLTVSAAGLSPWSRQVKVFARSFAPRGEVALYTARANWCTVATANAQAGITAERLSGAGVTCTIFPAIDDLIAFDEADLAAWVEEKTDNGMLDVLVIYGYVPPTIYPPANALPNGSIAELFIESTDGDAIINHGDAFWYKSTTDNTYSGLRYLIDISGFSRMYAVPFGWSGLRGKALRNRLSAKPAFTIRGESSRLQFSRGVRSTFVYGPASVKSSQFHV